MKRTIYFVSIAVFGLFVVSNVLISQMYPSLLYDLVYYKKPVAARAFLIRINGVRGFLTQSRVLEDLTGANITKYFAQQKEDNSKKISHLEGLLSKSPQNRDVLVLLALEYKRNNNDPRAKQYYLKAKKIDPWLKIDKLEFLLRKGE